MHRRWDRLARPRWILAVALGGAALLGPAAATAQTAEELAKARATYQQGLSLEAAEDWAAALAKFEEVAQVRMTPQVRFHIGRCKEHLGRLTEALGDYRLAEHEADAGKIKEADEIAAAREALEGRVPKIVITVSGAQKPRITLDGVEIGEVGSEIMVNPGEHKLVVRWKGKKTQTTFRLIEGQTRTIPLSPPAGTDEDEDEDEDEQPKDPPEEDEGDGEREATPPPGPDTGGPPIDSGGPGALPWVLGGVGAVALIAAGVFYNNRNGAEADLEGVCRNGVCPESKKSVGDEGAQMAMLANVGLGIGVVSLGAAIALAVTAGGDEAPKPPPTTGFVGVDVVQSPHLRGVQVHGRF